nr:immunoglobulin light chain junction region [Macaca mulatta]MOV98331.1 immunoglobulin light chain junction region [Macaca mulatta]
DFYCATWDNSLSSLVF